MTQQTLCARCQSPAPTRHILLASDKSAVMPLGWAGILLERLTTDGQIEQTTGALCPECHRVVVSTIEEPLFFPNGQALEVYSRIHHALKALAQAQNDWMNTRCPYSKITSAVHVVSQLALELFPTDTSQRTAQGDANSAETSHVLDGFAQNLLNAGMRMTTCDTCGCWMLTRSEIDRCPPCRGEGKND